MLCENINLKTQLGSIAPGFRNLIKVPISSHINSQQSASLLRFVRDTDYFKIFYQIRNESLFLLESSRKSFL